MTSSALRELHAAGATDQPETVLADAAYSNGGTSKALASDGDRPAGPAGRRSHQPRPGRFGGI
jgi:hypothetical protein